MNILLIQPHVIRLQIGGKRCPDNRAGEIYNILKKYGHNIFIGTSVHKKDLEEHKHEFTYNLLKYSTSYSTFFNKIDRIILLSSCWNYCYPPGEPFDNKKRCILVLKYTKCPVIYVQDDYTTAACGFPANIEYLKRLHEKLDDNMNRIDFTLFNNKNDMHKNRKIKILMQCKYPDELAWLYTDRINNYISLKYEFYNWGTHHYTFKDLMLKPNSNPENILSYVGVMRPNRSRLELINNKRTEMYGRWKHPLSKVQQNKPVNVIDVPDIYNNSIATIWTHDDKYEEMSVEGSRYYEGIHCGTALLIDEIMLKYKKDCYLYGIDCFYKTKYDLWQRVARLKKDKKYRLSLINQQQEVLKNYINYNKIEQEFIKILED